MRWTLSGEELPPRPSDPAMKTPTLTPTPEMVRELEKSDLDVVFQPIVSLRDGRQFALEALARCRVEGFTDPMVLFETAAKMRYCGRLGRNLRELTFARCPGMPIFVNVHPDELQSRWIVRPDDPIGFHDAPVYLEVTEAAAFDYFDLVSATLGELKGRGVRTVIDDFGAGYSSLARIADLEPAIVKLDRSLVIALDRHPNRQRLVKSVVELCVQIGAEVVIEGIETPGELSAVIDSGAHYGQGYLLARPAWPIPEVRWPDDVRLATRCRRPRAKPLFDSSWGPPPRSRTVPRGPTQATPPATASRAVPPPPPAPPPVPTRTPVEPLPDRWTDRKSAVALRENTSEESGVQTIDDELDEAFGQLFGPE